MDLERRLRDTETALRAAEARVAALYDHAPDPMLEVDGDGRIRAANATATARLGAPLVGRRFSSLFAPASAEVVERMFGRAVEASLDRELELDGGRIVLLRGVPIPERLDGVLVALRDVSDRLRMREELERGRRLAAIGRIAGAIAHEVNNPLTVLQLRTDLLMEEGELAEEARRQVELLRDSTQRIARIVRTLQRVSRPPIPAPEPIALHDLVLGAVRGAAEGLACGAVRVDPPEAAVFVRGDPEALELAIEHLLVASAADPTAHARIEAVGTRARVDVVVAGGSWPEGVLPDPAATPDAHGRIVGGIGLALAGTIASDHGGEVRIVPRDGGAVLRLEVPRVQSRSSARRSGQPRVLVIDDEPLVASVLVDWCRRAGHAVDVVETAEEAMERIRAGATWDVVLADDQLPGTSGRELVAWLARERPDLAGRAALMSGGLPEDDAVPFLPKPFTRRQLAELVDGLLAR